ncbi:GpE family phage tail protein [Photorhabdus bodei]|nr:GpE family phage tail protein [Photorhabdus bodei]
MSLIIWHYRNDFSKLSDWIREIKTVWQASAMLARWFRFQPSEIDNLALDEFECWLNEANTQIKRENEDG